MKELTATPHQDAFFGPAFVDRDEWRDSPHRHRYVHGGFENTDTRFSVYLPPAESYGGRFVQWLQGGAGGSENSATVGGALAVAAKAGAILVESNQGHVGNSMTGLKGDPTILQWRASAQTARFARELAAEMYGAPPRYGYALGGSAGAMRTTFVMEHAPDLYDGGVAFMINHGGMVAYQWPLLAHAELLLREHYRDVVDSTDAGGSGDPFAVLPREDQRQILAELYRAGFPRGAEFLIAENGIWVLGLVGTLLAQPGYFADFWTKPGHAGYDDPGSVQRFRVERTARVERVLTARELNEFAQRDLNRPAPGIHAALPPDQTVAVLTDIPASTPGLVGSRLQLPDGRSVFCTGLFGAALTALVDSVGFAGVAPGDEIAIDNRYYIAYAHLHRHLADPRHPETQQHWVDGRPMHPLRLFDLDALAQMSSGRFDGRLALLQHAHDRECWPSSGEFFAQRARGHLGDAVEDRFRFWWIERAAHLPPIAPGATTRLIPYMGAYERALHHVIEWVERGVPPPPSTTYEFDQHRRLQLPPAADERGGFQPVVSVTVGGEKVISVPAGTTVTVRCQAAVPPGGGRITRVDWDWDGAGAWADSDDCDGSEIALERTHAYAQGGTYFVTARVHSTPESGDAAYPVQNLDRARVIVS